MLDQIQTIVQPVIVETLLTLILAAIAFLMRKLPASMQMQIEEKHRRALHSALETGTAYALDALGDALRLNPAIATADATVARVITYTQGSVPDALRHFVPSAEHFANMARAKIAEELARRGLDPLTTALQAAGADAAHP